MAVACGAASDDGALSSVGTAKDPVASNELAELGANPQRAPQTWTRPDSSPAFPEDDPFVALPEVGSGAEASPPPSSEAPSDTEDFGGPAAAPITPRAMPFRGVNLAGAEFGSALPGIYGKDYTFPTRAEVDYYLGKGMNTFRIGFKWERMQRFSYGALDATYLARLDSILTHVTSKGATVILNPHNFARYYGSTVGSLQVPNGVFADFWRRMATQYKSNARVVFNLVNEPHDISSEQWVGAANAAIVAIRGADANNVVVVPGNGWTGAHSWNSADYGTPNAQAMLNIKDARDNLVFEVHQYMDSDSSGSSGSCTSTTVGRERLVDFVKWLRDNKRKGFLGEFAGGDNWTCNAAVRNMLDYVHASSDVLVGWTWWAGGPWWGDYKFSLDPKAGVDRPQMSLLTPYLGL